MMIYGRMDHNLVVFPLFCKVQTYDYIRSRVMKVNDISSVMECACEYVSLGCNNIHDCISVSLLCLWILICLFVIYIWLFLHIQDYMIYNM